MSVYVSGRVWKKSKQRGSALVVLLAIADFSDPYGVSWPLVDTLADYARIKTRNAQYILTDLEGRQEILRIIELGRGKQSFTIVTVGLRYWMVYRILRQHPEISLDKTAAKTTLDAWIKNAIEYEKVQAAAPIGETEKVQGIAPKVKQKVQSSVIKGAIQRKPYKEEPSGTVIKNKKGASPRPIHSECGNLAEYIGSGEKVALCRDCNKQFIPSGESPPKSKKGAPPKRYELPNDSYVAIFRKAYLGEYGMAFIEDGGDVGQYGGMRSNRNGEITPENWKLAVENFFRTPRNDHRLKELCANFAGFHKHALDVYGMPARAGNGSTRERKAVIPG